MEGSFPGPEHAFPAPAPAARITALAGYLNATNCRWR